jgi:hypothetical protein
MEADMGSTIEIRGTKRGSEEPDSEYLTEILEEAKLEDSDEVQIVKGTGSRNLDVVALSLPSEDSSYSYLPTPYLKGMGAIDCEKGAPEKGIVWGTPGMNSPEASNKGSLSEPEVEGGVGV